MPNSDRRTQRRGMAFAATRTDRDFTAIWLIIGALLLLFPLASGSAQATEPTYAARHAAPTVEASEQLAQNAAPQDADPGLQQVFRGIINAQLAAFLRDDGAEAFSYASPDIRRKFGSPNMFMRMVQTAYTAIYRPAAVEFGELGSLRGQPAQTVSFVGLDGKSMTAVYIMEQQADGGWLIDGVFLVEAGDKVA